MRTRILSHTEIIQALGEWLLAQGECIPGSKARIHIIADGPDIGDIRAECHIEDPREIIQVHGIRAGMSLLAAAKVVKSCGSE